MSIALTCAGLTHRNGVTALQPLTLTVQPGERVAIIGPSGAGKTTLLRLLGTGLHATEGHLAVLGEDPALLPPRALRRLRSRVGMIHQSPPLPGRQRLLTAVLAGRLGQWSLLRALGSLCYPADIPGARMALAQLDLEDRLFDRCDQLSGGQLQRVGIARALYQCPEMLLADEPVSAMDPVLAAHTLGVLNRHAINHQATLVASLHAVELALQHFPRILGLRDGQLLFDRPAHAVTEQDLQALYDNRDLQPMVETSAPAPTQPIPVPQCS